MVLSTSRFYQYLSGRGQLGALQERAIAGSMRFRVYWLVFSLSRAMCGQTCWLDADLALVYIGRLVVHNVMCLVVHCGTNQVNQA